MKKFFIALSVLAALMLSVVPSQALIGMPDDAPGTDAVVPFICDISGTTGLNTLIVFTDIGGAWPAKAGSVFHYTVYTKRSATVYDDFLKGTAYDIVPTDAFTIVGKMAPAIREQLEVDIDGDGVNDHYAGYIYFLGDYAANSVVGQFYFVNLPKGVAASANIPMKEYGIGSIPAAFEPYMLDQSFYGFGVELFSPNALAAAEDLQAGITAPSNAFFFGIFPRFYILDENASTWMLFWKSMNSLTVPAVPLPGTLHLNFFDQEENVVSSNLTIDDELTLIDIEPFLPLSIFPTDVYPKEGWLQLEWFTGNTYLQNLEMLGWTYQRAYGSASESWTVLNPMWRVAF